MQAERRLLRACASGSLALLGGLGSRLAGLRLRIRLDRLLRLRAAAAAGAALLRRTVAVLPFLGLLAPLAPLGVDRVDGPRVGRAAVLLAALAAPAAPRAPAAPLGEVAQELARERRWLAGHPRARSTQDLFGLGRVRERGRQQRRAEAAVLLARGLHEAARVARVRSARRVHEQAEQPLRLRPALHRVLLVYLAGVLGEPPEPRVGLVAAADRALRQCLQQHLHALAPLVARPAADDVDGLVERLGVAYLRDLLKRPHAQLRVAVALEARDDEAPAQLAGRVEVQHRLRAAPVVRGHARSGERGPDVLLLPREVLDGDPPQLALEDRRAPVWIVRDRQNAALDAEAPATAAPHRADDDRAAAIDVAVEQRMKRHHRVVVLRGRVHEVDDDAGLLAGVPARDAPDALLVDALRSGRREVHADGGARRVPALGEQLRVHEHVDLAALVSGEDARELALRRLSGDALRLHAGVLEGLGHVVGVAHAGRVHDAREVLEAHAVEVRDRRVERALVEQRGQLFLVEVLVDLALPERHLRDRPHADARRDAHAAQRRNHAPASGLREVEARRLRREEVGHVAGDERARGRHADEDRAEPGADRRARLLPERGVRLVADDDRVGVRDVPGVADEPLVGLDRDRPLHLRLALVLEDRGADALAVAAVLQLAVELIDEVAPVGEDQDPAGPRAFHEAERGDGLAGPRRVLEPEAARGVGVVGGARRLGGGLLLGGLGVVPVERLVVVRELLVALELELAGGQLLDAAVAAAVRAGGAVPVRAAAGLLRLGQQGDERA